MNGITPDQYATLMKPLNATRVAKRKGGNGKELSYLESYDVRAHLIRVFGFGNFDAGIVTSELVFQRGVEIGHDKKPGWEVAYRVEFRLTIKDCDGIYIASYTEAAVGSATGSVGLADLHDNALKTAASDALKRCAINLGTQFGLGLYDNGSTREIVKGTIVKPEGTPEKEGPTAEQRAVLAASLGAVEVKEGADA